MKSRNLLLLMTLATLTACGGGGGGSSGGSPAPASSSPQPASVAPAPSAPTPAPAPVNSGDMNLAGRLYKGTERTPEGFDLESRPSSVTGTLATRHLKNTDLATGPQALGASYEMCTNDLAQAVEWSEKQATWQGQYSDLAEVGTDERFFELVRVPRADVTAMIRHRIFRCDYLDRAGSDLRSDSGSAGSMNQRPLTAVELEKLSEYLWQFTMFNNSDYAVESSTTTLTGSQLVHTIRMGQLVRGTAATCDTVHVSDWSHIMSSVDGTLTRSLTAVRSFKVKGNGSGVESCAD
jgi:hypothetical protein